MPSCIHKQTAKPPIVSGPALSFKISGKALHSGKRVSAFLGVCRLRHRSAPSRLVKTHGRATFQVHAVTAATSAGGQAAEAPDAAGVLRYQRDLLGRMMSFLGPATLIPLGEPLMSLVDTVCIGQFAGTNQLAALGPANLVFSFAQYMFQSLQVATLSLLAGFLRDGRLKRSEETLSTAVVMAACLGLATTCILEAFPEAIIRATGLRDPALLSLSTEYVRLRGLAQPAVLVTMVAQSGLLAQQDSLTPALTVAVAVAVSLVGSVVFVAGLGWGLAGAAGTTVACQYVGAVALLYALSVRGKLRIRLSLPRREVLWQLLRTMGPLSITYICKNVSYLFIQTTAASLATAKLAAHQALFSVWNLLAWTVTPFEQAALTYLPGTRGWRKAAGIALLVGLGAAGGVLCGGVLAALVCAVPQAMTRDATVWPHMQSVAGLASLSMLALGADVVSSGVNIGMGDARYVAQSYIITLVALGAFMAASRALGWELQGVWCGVVVFFGVRALQSAGRVLWRYLGPGAAAEGEGEEEDEAGPEGGRRYGDSMASVDVVSSKSNDDNKKGSSGNNNSGSNNNSDSNNNSSCNNNSSSSDSDGLHAVPIASIQGAVGSGELGVGAPATAPGSGSQAAETAVVAMAEEEELLDGSQDGRERWESESEEPPRQQRGPGTGLEQGSALGAAVRPAGGA